MLGILGESFMVAARTDAFRHDRPQGVVETPANHDPEREWMRQDAQRRLNGRGRRKQARTEKRRADRAFWRGRRGQQETPDED